MNLPRYFLVVVFLAFADCVMICGPVNAQGGESLSKLSAQAQKIKVGETTEAEVISLLGQPSKTFAGTGSRAGARKFKEFKKLFYGCPGPGCRSLPEKNIVVIIDKSTGKVTKVNIKPSQ